MVRVFETELAARVFMDDLKRKGVPYSYWHRSICQHIVTVRH
jgi:hypothetical protein